MSSHMMDRGATPTIFKSLHLNNLGPLRISTIALLLAMICLCFADLSITRGNPGSELQRMLAGLLSPSLNTVYSLPDAIAKTISYALLAVILSASIGFLLTPLFKFNIIRLTCAVLRSVHELFWALIFLQLFGLHPITGILAIALPYTGTFTKIFSEIIEENAPSSNLNRLSHSRLTTFFYIELPKAWPTIVSYTRYRFECALRASTILGFVGLPTLGYYLESALLEGHYNEVFGLLALLILLIVSIRWWLIRTLLPLYTIAALYFIGDWQNLNISTFFFSGLIPSIVEREGLSALLPWCWAILVNSGFEATVNTIILSQIALALTGILALLSYPMISESFVSPKLKALGTLFLATVRAIPEFFLTFIILIVTGPSMLPAVLALAIHNGAIVGQLTGEYATNTKIPPEKTSHINRFLYYVTPQIYGQFLAFLFYRWEVIMRETAILGILGIHTLGFYIDSAFQDIQFDKAIFFISLTALLNIAIDGLSTWVRNKTRHDSTLNTSFATYSPVQ